ncbi:hypothetical protein HPB50_004228 [Hyalomma asiaticum]|uniref:Uncharacterized protein n=1 Tax=Hyalomma asiaticum TaxID=266040 RepID=A0ACB7RHK2_HYAAI|nr:hypothetical protein HPB50_004228 [Hyalomma asiaticum]
MPDLRRVHRFRDHVVAGVNWRPTRFVDEVPSSRVCDLCRMIPRRILLLPCSHTLCQSCHAANSQGRAGRCPLDQEPFEEAECVGYDFPTRMANTLKVYCWNEEHGCEFEGSVEGMLRHYENECAFHAVECLRCGQRVLHRDLSTHYVAGCSTDVSPAVTEDTPSVSTTLTLQDVSAALEELKTIMRDSNNDQLLLANQTQMNELTERVRNLESRAAVSSREFGATASSEAVPISSTVSQEHDTQQQNPTEGAGTSSTSRSCSENSRASADLRFFGMRGHYPCSVPSLAMNMLEYGSGSMIKLKHFEGPCLCRPNGDSWVHCHRVVPIPEVYLEPLLRAWGGRMQFEIEISRKTNVVSGHSTT